MFKNIIQLLCVFLLLINAAVANDLYVKLPQKAQEVLQPKPSALTLSEIENRVVNEHLDIQISYEKLLQAQKRISQARSQFFPYGAGTVAAMYFLNIWNPLLLVELVTSIPSKVFQVQSEKNLARAQMYNNEALKENIKNQVAHLYYNILKEESALRISQLEISLMEALMVAYEERVALGLTSESELSSLRLRLLDLRDAHLKFNAYLVAEKAAFNIMLGQSSEDSKAFELQTVSKILESEQFEVDVNNLVQQALSKSPEIVAADYMITAAFKAKRSAKWSILSFNGIGFGYWGRVQVAGSKVEEARLNRELVEDTVMNHVHLKHNALDRALDFLKSEQDVLEETEFFTNSEIEQFKAQEISLDVLLETELLFLKDYREMVLAHYDSYIKLNDLERATLTKLSQAPASGHFEVKMDHWKRKKFLLSVSGPSLDEVEKVVYTFDESVGLRDMTSYAVQDDFTVVLKLYDPEGISGVAKVFLKNGATQVQQFKF